MAIFTDVILTLGTSGNDQISGTTGNDDLRGSQGNDVIFAHAGDDFLRGGAGDDYLSGGIGNDRLEGAGDKDTLYGGKGNDLIYGGAGRDILSGDYGTDTLYGGNEGDLFYFTKSSAGADGEGGRASDTIRDFAVGDVIHFDKYGVSSKLMFAQDGLNTTISVDVNGDGTAEYLAVTVTNSLLADVQAATSFGGLVF